MTELSFLLDLLFNHRLPKTAKEAIGARIKEVEEKLNEVKDPRIPFGTVRSPIVAGAPQSASTLAAMEKHGIVEPAPVEVIAQTPAAQAAMLSRQAAINSAGKIDKNAERPRKF
jgi:hypothetical protein